MSKHERINQSRRNFMRLSVAGAAGLALGPLDGLRQSSPMRVQAAPIIGTKRLIVTMLRGGNDGLNTLIPVNLGSYQDRRPNLAIDPANALEINQGPAATSEYVLHSSLVNTQALYNEGSVAFVQGVGYPDENLSHFTSEDIWSYGVRGNFGSLGIPISGWLARFADNYASTGTGVVSIGQGRPRELVGANTTPLILQDLEGFKMNPDWGQGDNQPLREQLVSDLLGARAWQGLRADAAASIEQAYALSQQVQDSVANFQSNESYEDRRVGKSMRGIATLIQAGFDTQVFFTGQGGYDTHSTQGTRHAELLTEFDRNVGALANDLKAMGVWNNAVIAVFSEFGRRNYENGSTGTDHGHGNTLMLLGGAVNGGIYGTQLTNTLLDEEWLPYEVDFRTIYKQILQDHMGVDPDPVFPESQPINDSPGDLISGNV